MTSINHTSKHVEAAKELVSSLVQDQAQSIHSKKRAHETETHKSTVVSTTTKKLKKDTSVKDDILVRHNPLENDQDSDNKSGSSWFDLSDSAPDPLTQFMFENAPLLMELAVEGSEAMTKAQNAEAQSQVNSAVAAAKSTVEKGCEQAKQMMMKAAGEFASMGVAALQAGMMARDSFADQDIHNKDLEAHDEVMRCLDKPPLESKVTSGSEVSTNPDAEIAEGSTKLSEQEKTQIKEKAEKFKETHAKAYEESLEKVKNEKVRNFFKKTDTVGLGRNDDFINGEHEVIANREASKTAFKEEIAADPSFQKLIENNPEAQRQFMSDLFGDGTEGVLSPESRMNLIGDWGGSNPPKVQSLDADGNKLYKDKAGNMTTEAITGENQNKPIYESANVSGSTLREELLNSYGSTKAGKEMKANLDEVRSNVSRKAQYQREMMRKSLDNRQIIFQNLVTNLTNATVDMLQKRMIARAAQAEANASVQSATTSAQAQNMSQLSGYRDTFIKRLTDAYDWFDGLRSQLVAAQTRG